MIVPCRQCRGLIVRPRQEGKERLQPFRVEGEAFWKLPENGPELVAKCQGPGGEEIGYRRLGPDELQHVSYVAWALDREHEVVGGGGGPVGKAAWHLHAIEGAIDFKGVKLP